MPGQILRIERHASQPGHASIDRRLRHGFRRVREKLEPSIADVLPFLHAFIADPGRVGAVAPSGRALAEAITAEIRPESAPVIELGPGTGAFTQQILDRGVPEDQLTLVEFGPDFAHRLQLRYPHARVLRMDASLLRHVEAFDDEKAGAVVSGLPLLSMSTRQIIGILGGAFRHLRSDGAFYQFTYSPRCPVPRVILERLGLRATRISRTFANIPPAGVYRITRRPNSARHLSRVHVDPSMVEPI
jgi:phosphatidylethanolamine/phosphatidyl-N-methylethanolamine N-methyltransferase